MCLCVVCVCVCLGYVFVCLYLHLFGGCLLICAGGTDINVCMCSMIIRVMI